MSPTPYDIFRHCEAKQFWRKFAITLPLFIHKFFRYQKLCQTQMGSPTKFFGAARQQNLYRKSWYSPLRQKNFSIPETLWNTEDSSTKFFGTERKKLSDGKSRNPPPLLCINFFDTSWFLNTEKDSPMKFLGFVRQHSFNGKSWYSPPSYP